MGWTTDGSTAGAFVQVAHPTVSYARRQYCRCLVQKIVSVVASISYLSPPVRKEPSRMLRGRRRQDDVIKRPCCVGPFSDYLTVTSESPTQSDLVNRRCPRTTMYTSITEGYDMLPLSSVAGERHLRSQTPHFSIGLLRFDLHVGTEEDIDQAHLQPASLFSPSL